MKKALAIILALTVVLVCFAACGSKTPTDANTPTDAANTTVAAPSYADAVEVLTTIFAAYAEENVFPVAGGDEAHMDFENPAPGKYDYTLTDELSVVAQFPVSQSANIEDAATAMHMMNANTFTAGAYHFVDAADKDASVETIKSNILARQWMCGFPETLIIVDLGGNTLLTAFGNGQVVDAFKTTTLSTFEGATVVVETPIG